MANHCPSVLYCGIIRDGRCIVDLDDPGMGSMVVGDRCVVDLGRGGKA